MVKQLKDRILVTLNKRRRTFRLAALLSGPSSQSKDRALRKVLQDLEELEVAFNAGIKPDPNVVQSVRKDGYIAKRCEELGLIPPVLTLTVEDLFNEFVERKKSEWSGATYLKWNDTTRQHVLPGLGNNRLIVEITREDADQFHAMMKSKQSSRTNKPLSPSHISKIMANSRSLFKYAVDREYISRNPFDHIKRGKERKPEGRNVEVSARVIREVIAAAPSAEWRLLIAIWRWLGARKTEPLGIKVSGVKYHDGYATIAIPDCKRRDEYGNHVYRQVPVFPEISPHLLDVLEQHSGQSNLLLEGLQKHGTSIDKPFKDIIRRAGHQPWPAICNNMRATRANEVEREFGTVAESNWIGHDPGTFRKHYSQVHVADMKKACAIDTNMTQNGGQQSCTESPEESEKASMQVSALLCNLLQTSQVPPLGLEPRTL